MRLWRSVSALVCLLTACAPDPGPQAYFERGLEAYHKSRYMQAAKDFLKLAEKGDPKSQLYLARMYANGEGFDIDYNQAAKWYFKAAEGGLMEAQRDLASLYAWGIGVTRDPVESAYWFRRAANQGSTEAQLALAELLSADGATKEQRIEAYSWYTIASRQVASDQKATVLIDRRSLLPRMSRNDVVEAERRAYSWIPARERPAR